MDLNDYPTTERVIPWKPVALIAGGVVVLIVVIILIARMVGSDEVQYQQEAIVDVKAMVDDCESARDPVGCKRQKVTETASRTGSLDACDLLEAGQERDNCYWIVAMDSSDLAFCDGIANEEWKLECVDGIAQDQAFAKRDASYCDKIQNVARAARCKGILEEEPVSADIDEDGLTNEEELDYRTDPENPDSDGDGYKDGDEVNAGYNPLGAGRLE